MLKKLLFISFVCFSFSDLTAQTLEDLKTDEGLVIEIFASGINSPRQLAEGIDGRIYVGSKNEGKIFALRDTDGNGVVDERRLIAENLTFSRACEFF